MENESKKKRKINIVDIIVIVIVLAAAAFLGWRFLRNVDSTANMGEVTYTVVVEAVPIEMYENIASWIPSQLIASGAYYPGHVMAVSAEPCEVTELEKTNVTNSSIKSKIIPDGEYVTLTFTITAKIELDSLTSEVGTQEVRTGRSHIVKTKYFEITGTIISVDRPE